MNAVNPSSICAPAGAYSHGIVAPAAGRWLHVSGQIGMLPDGTMAEGFEAQARVAWRNLVAVLAEAGMGVEHLVKINSYLVEPSHLPLLGKVRAEFQPPTPPASTLVFVKALVRAEWLYEVDAVAFRA
ncbi:MAG: RidA family protein [Burkholderiales bacterium]|nr:RidA family protein [Burkholderiales bacterium]MCC7113316.1 RidA family protein [Burkholderiales bacterium]